jgi:hypothetical protein
MFSKTETVQVYAIWAAPCTNTGDNKKAKNKAAALFFAFPVLNLINWERW